MSLLHGESFPAQLAGWILSYSLDQFSGRGSAEVRDTRLDANYAVRFLSQNVIPDPEGRILKLDLYEKSVEWCRKRGIQKPMTEPIFSKQVYALFQEARPGKQLRGRLEGALVRRKPEYVGIKLRDEELDPDRAASDDELIAAYALCKRDAEQRVTPEDYWERHGFPENEFGRAKLLHEAKQACARRQRSQRVEGVLGVVEDCTRFCETWCEVRALVARLMLSRRAYEDSAMCWQMLFTATPEDGHDSLYDRAFRAHAAMSVWDASKKPIWLEWPPLPGTASGGRRLIVKGREKVKRS